MEFTSKRSLKIVALLVLIVIVYGCNVDKSPTPVFRILPHPQEIVINGQSNIFPSTIQTFYAADKTKLPKVIEFTNELKESTLEKAQIVFSVNLNLDTNAEGYKLSIRSDQIEIQAKDSAGLLYAFTTLEQLIQDAKDQNVSLPICEIKDAPSLSYRAIHLDIKHHMEKQNYYYDLMDRLRFYKINGVIVEIEDKLAYPSQPKVGAPEALSVEQWRALSDYALERNIRISPLVQGLGHASFILNHQQYAFLRDDPNSDWAFNPLNEDTYSLQFDLYKDALDAFPHGSFLHVGGDEVHTTGRGSKKSPLELQLIWLNRVSDFAKQHGKTPIFWDDMPLKFGNVYDPMFKPNMPTTEVDSIWETNQNKLEEVLDLFPKNCIYMRWNYRAPESYGNSKAMQWFRDHGLKVMGATAGQTRWPLMPQNESNMDNISAFARSSIATSSNGLLLTLWDDDSPLFELYHRGIVAFAANTWSGDLLNKQELKEAFRHRNFSHELADSSYAFIDSLEPSVALWKNIFLKGNKRNYLASMKHPLEEGVMDLPDLEQPGVWTTLNKERLDQAQQMFDASSGVLEQLKIIEKKAFKESFPARVLFVSTPVTRGANDAAVAS